MREMHGRQIRRIIIRPSPLLPTSQGLFAKQPCLFELFQFVAIRCEMDLRVPGISDAEPLRLGNRLLKEFCGFVQATGAPLGEFEVFLQV